jgi:hypothetical protein
MLRQLRPSLGFRLDTDVWLKEYEEAKVLAQEVLQLIQVWEGSGSVQW